MAGSTGRTFRRWSRRLGGGPRAIVAVVIVVVIIAGVVVAIAVGGSSGSTKTKSSGTPAQLSAVDEARTAAPGVSAASIRVVFPVVSLNSLAGRFGFASDIEYGKQEAAIHTFVNEINDQGGISGRKIDADIETYDPTDLAAQRALCKEWTQGSTPAFAVLDGIGAWEGDNQLCITQEGKTPMISQWGTVTDWTTKGSPYLWWTGPDQSVLLKNLVAWGHSAGLVSEGKKVGILVGDRPSDQEALNSTVVPALKALGVTPVVQKIAATADASSATMAAQAPLIVQAFRTAGVQSVMPLIPFNSFFPYLQSETDQQYFPKLLLSDYESSIETSLGLMPEPYGKALDGQEGITTYTLGGIDDDRPVSQGGYDPGVRSCYATWKAHNAPPPPPNGPYIEEQGPIQAWCQAIRLFAAAAKDAGPKLTIRSFVQGMSKITNFDGTSSPTLSYSPTKLYGPTQYRVVKLHVNDPPGPDCKQPKFTNTPQGTCWVIQKDWTPLTTG